MIPKKKFFDLYNGNDLPSFESAQKQLMQQGETPNCSRWSMRQLGKSEITPVEIAARLLIEQDTDFDIGDS